MDSDARQSLKLLEEGMAQLLREVERLHARVALLEPKRYTCPQCGRDRVSTGRLGEKCYHCGHIPGAPIRSFSHVMQNRNGTIAWPDDVDPEEELERTMNDLSA